MRLIDLTGRQFSELIVFARGEGRRGQCVARRVRWGMSVRM